MQTLAEHGMLDGGLRMRAMVLPDEFFYDDSPNAMYARAGIDAKGIVAKVFDALGKDYKAETVKLALRRAAFPASPHRGEGRRTSIARALRCIHGKNLSGRPRCIPAGCDRDSGGAKPRSAHVMG